MNLVDEVSEIVRTTPVSDIGDLAFLARINPDQAHEKIDSKPGYKSLVEAMTAIFAHAEDRGVPRDKILGTLLGAHDEIVRYVVQKAVRAKLLDIGAVGLETINARRTLEATTAKLDETRKELDDITRTKTRAQFRSYLRYTADNYAMTEHEKEVILAVASRV